METELKIKKMNKVQERIYKYILERIMDKRLPVGERIPTEVELARKLLTNRMNVHNALVHLEAHGVLFRNKRGGTTVACLPNSFAISELKRKVSRFVTVLNPLFPQAAHLHWNPEITGILQDGLEEHGLELNMVDVYGLDNIEKISGKLKEITHEGTAALLCISGMGLNQLLIDNPEIFYSYHRNVFVFARDTVEWASFPYNVVSVDLFDEGLIAAKRATSSGYEQVYYCFFRNVSDRSWLKSRRDGLCCGMRRAGFESGLTDIVLDEEPELLLNMIGSGKKVMLVVSNDYIAAEIIDKIRGTTGKVAGADYGLISFDNDAKFKKYKLTTIAPPLHEIGKALAELIVSSVDQQVNRTSFIKIKSRLVSGNTC